MKKICKNCFLSSTALMNYNIFCGLNGQAVKYPDGWCRFCITEDDVEAARKECLEKRPESSPVPPMWKATLSDLEIDKMQLEKDILRIKLEREKLRLEKEKAIKNPPSFAEFFDEWLGKLAAAHGMSVSRLKEDWEAELVRGLVKSLPVYGQTNHAKMQTFLCENCGEYVLVPAEGVGSKVHWKCMACHQENCFEVAQE